MKLKKGKVVLSEINITSDFKSCNKPLKDIDFPKDCILISIIRDEEIIIPNGYTVIKSGDLLIASSSQESQTKLRDYFSKDKKL
jgi:trk system potassium uptake protein TrkA